MTTALTPEQPLMQLVDDYAESRHVCGHHTYNHKTEQARKNVALRIAALEAELAACKKDAERYRWLRDTNKERTDMTTGKGILWPNEVSSVWWGLPEDQWDFFSGCLRCADGPEFDTAIDAAMAAQEKA